MAAGYPLRSIHLREIEFLLNIRLNAEVGLDNRNHLLLTSAFWFPTLNVEAGLDNRDQTGSYPNFCL